MKPDLSVKIKDITFRNPVTVASGTFGSEGEYQGWVDYEKLGAIVTKTVTRKPREGNPMPRIYETPAGMLNAIGLQNKGIEEFIEKKIPFFSKIRTPLIVNIAGESVEDYVCLAEKLSHLKEVSGVELNISCPNVKKGLEFCAQPGLAYEVVSEVRSVTPKLLITKVSPEAHDFLGVVEACVKAGTDAFTAINTIRGMAIDVEARRPRLANVFGGLSGPAIRPVALRYVYEIKRRFDVPVIAAGGICCTNDALEFIIAGAHMVAVGTANFVEPRATMEILSGIEKYLGERRLESIDEVRGTVKVDC
ncbi:MAG TPA: dihydroorotate dehydrogenase [Candidatus Omnitrophota bacterium]|nr:dihydroorotate dehydrogenase [Candidatus Omnitrophota bacterium]